MFGLAWFVCIHLFNTVVIWFLTHTEELLVHAACLLECYVFIMIILYSFGWLFTAKNLYSILRNGIKKTPLLKLPAIIGALYPPVMSLMLLIAFIKKRSYIAIGFVVGALACYILISAFKIPVTIWWCLFYGEFFLLICACSLGMSGKREKHVWKYAVYPLGIFFLLCASLYAGELYFKLQVKKSQHTLSQLVQSDISRDALEQRNKSGFSFDQEPLNSFYKADCDTDFDHSKYKTPQEAQKILKELHKKYADFFVALNKFLQLQPQRVSYEMREDVPILVLLLPEMYSFRFAYKTLALEIRSNHQNKKQVIYYNNAMLKMREWCIQNETLLDKTYAGNMERVRLKELSHVIAAETFTKAEVKELIGTEPDWNKQFSVIFASENAIIEECIPMFQNESGDNLPSQYSPYSKKKWKFFQKYAPLLIRMNLQRDYLFALNYYCKFHALLNQVELSGIEKNKCAELDQDTLGLKLFMLSQLFITKSLPLIFTHISKTQDCRQMALLAAEVMEYRKQHGRLPENLAFLPKIPLSKLDHKPLMYEKTSDGFRIYSYTQNGKKPDAKDTNHSYSVRLPEFQQN